jgi:2-polyprenyl-3-methyl-5-hydroxy-6-metoxy-1,4-benzoquinol methylase
MPIFKVLEGLSLTSFDTRRIYANKTRDVNPLTVYIDDLSGVIYIDDFYVGDSQYEEGNYNELKSSEYIKLDYDREVDCRRRVNQHKKYITDKKILDFGCGAGDFLKVAQKYASSVTGVELQKNYMEHLNENGINCFSDLSDIEDNSLDSIFLFHVLEHLPEPLEMLSILKSKLRDGGLLVAEVPHANDFLLSELDCDAFKEFTLWSQHLILHTRNSLNAFFNNCDLHNISIKGFQRYPISNHLYWLRNKKPGGHKLALSVVDTDDLNRSYESALSLIDSNDTLIAIGAK